jgi:hypothetical protein
MNKIYKIIEQDNKDEFSFRHAVNMEGKYIGLPAYAEKLTSEYGINPETISDDHNVCSIGFSKKDNKWYGWSHRAIYGFEIGSTCEKGDAHYKEKSQDDRGEWVARTIEDAKQMAIDFANSVA